jgi:hypothetical protein
MTLKVILSQGLCKNISDLILGTDREDLDISHLSQTLKNFIRYDCLNVCKQHESFPGGTENVFLHDICKRIFCKNYFRCFARKRNEKGD